VRDWVILYDFTHISTDTITYVIHVLIFIGLAKIEVMRSVLLNVYYAF